MEAVFLGQFLLQEGVVTREQLAQGLEHQRRANRRLGEMAVERGFISASDAGLVYAAQRFRDLPFGEMAAEMGLLRREDLDTMLFLHTVHTARLGEALLELGFIDKDRYSSQLSRFFRVRRGNTVDMAYLTDGSAAGALLSSLTGAAQRACLRFAGLCTTVLEVGADLDHARYRSAWRYSIRTLAGEGHYAAVLVGGSGAEPGREVFEVLGRYLYQALASRGVQVEDCVLAPQPVSPVELPRAAAAVRLAAPEDVLTLAVACGPEDGR
ncbi:MAG: hypothetical protein AB1916_00360 [Thermodesulfobacteriota bacterium]